MDASRGKLTIAIPVQNAESALPLLLSRTIPVMDRLPGGPHELLSVIAEGSGRYLPDFAAAERSLRSLCRANWKDPKK